MASPPLIVPADGQPTTDTSGLTQVTLTAYNARGEAWQTTDPAGTVTRTICDDAGRTIDVVQNYAVDVNGNPLVAPVENINTTTTYNSANQVAETAVASDGGTQTTQYVYDAGHHFHAGPVLQRRGHGRDLRRFNQHL